MGVQLSFSLFFSNPTIELLAKEIGSLQKSLYDPIPKVPARDHYVLSQAQRRLWILDQLEERSTAYIMPAAYELKGALETEVLEKCFKSLISRHEILRTTIIIVDGEPRQKVHEEQKSVFTLQYTDLRSYADKHQRAAKLTNEEALIPFDLQRGPLLRASVLQLEDAHFILLFTMHHIISDGWSLDVLAGELLDLYKSFKEKQDNLLPPVPVQYKDYAAWQENKFQCEKFIRHEAFWLEEFKNGVPVLELVTDYPRTSRKTYNGYKLYTDLDPQFIKQLKEYVTKKEVSPFVLVLTAANVLLYRYTGQTDIVLGSPTAGRTHPDLEKQIGFYVNTLALRNSFNDCNTFGALLALVNHTTIGAFDHQDYPFNRLVDKLGFVTDRSRSPLFDILIQWLTHSIDTTEPYAEHGIKIKPYRTAGTTSIFDLSFHFIESGNEAVYMMAEYNSDLYKEKTVMRFSNDLLKILSEAIKDDTWCIKNFELTQGDDDWQEENLFINQMLNIK